MLKNKLISILIIISPSVLFAINKGDICLQAGIYNPVMYRYYQQNKNTKTGWNILMPVFTLGMYPPSTTINFYYTFNSYFSLGASFGAGGIKKNIELSTTLNAYLHVLQPIFDKKKSETGDIVDVYFLGFIGFDHYQFKKTKYDSTSLHIIENKIKKEAVNWGVGIGYKVQIAQRGVYLFGEFGKLEMSYVKLGFGYKFNRKKVSK